MTTEHNGDQYSRYRLIDLPDDDSDFDDDSDSVDSESKYESDDSDDDEDEFIEQRLVRTSPALDSFDVEASEVPGGADPSYQFKEFGAWGKVALIFQTLGVVFGDVGTSQLYTFSVMFSKAPIKGKEDVLGALSLVLYTLILIPLVKYVLVVLWANDDGEGGTFALYSLICRHANVRLIPNHVPMDARLSSFRLKIPSQELERSLKLKEWLENSLVLKKLLLLVVLSGTAMVIANGVVTPAISVVSAVDGLKVGISGIRQREVEMVAVALLVILFTVQRYGTSKMGFIVGPALFIWFCCLAWMGIYNLVKYDRDVWRAFNPIHIYYYFERNKIQAWYALGGCLLCATGAEAMFADLCYFSVRTVQLTFVLFVFPCLILGYLGQAAYLMQNQGDSAQVFYSSVPSGAFWPVFVIANFAALIASRTMTTATFSCIKQSTLLGCFPRLKIVHTSKKFMGQIYIPALNWFLLAACVVLVCSVPSITEIGNAYGIAELGVMMMTTILVTLVMLLIWQINIVIILVFLFLSLGIELTFFSSVLWCVGDGSWIILPFAVAMLLMMAVWNYGNRLRYETEGNKKMSMEQLRLLGPSLNTIRTPGIGLVYSDLAKGIPAVFEHFINTLPAMHSMIIFVYIKPVSVPLVEPNERFRFRRVCSKEYHMFRCIARFGYKDVRLDKPVAQKLFELSLMESLKRFINREAQELLLESDSDSDTENESSLITPLLADPSSSRGAGSGSEASSVASDPEQNLQEELTFIQKQQDKQTLMVYLLTTGDIRASKHSWFIKKLAVNYFYSFLRKNSRRGISNLSVPSSHLIRVRHTYEV